MTVNLQQDTRTADAAAGRELPGPTSPAWQDPAVVAAIAGLPAHMLAGFEPTRDDLIATYGTADPIGLEAMGALDVDIAAAVQYVREDETPAGVR